MVNLGTIWKKSRTIIAIHVLASGRLECFRTKFSNDRLFLTEDLIYNGTYIPDATFVIREEVRLEKARRKDSKLSDNILQQIAAQFSANGKNSVALLKKLGEEAPYCSVVEADGVFVLTDASDSSLVISSTDIGKILERIIKRWWK